MNKKLRFMWMLLLAVVCTAAWAEKLDDNRADEYQQVTFSASTDESDSNVLTKGGITLTLSQGTWKPADSFGGTVGWEFAPGTTITVTGGDIVKIPLMFTGVQWGDPDPLSYEGNGIDGLWGFKNNWYWRSESEGEHTSVVLTVASDCKLTSLEVWTVSNGQATVAAPVIEGDKFFDDFTTVTITAEDGADIYYTTDYNVPTSASTKYTGPFNIYDDTRVMAIAVKNGINSQATRVDFQKRNKTAPAPEIDGETPFIDRTVVTITSDGLTDQIYYTLDGSTPGYESLQYTEPFALIETTTVKAMYIRNGGPSDIAEKTFVKVEANRPAAPTITGDATFSDRTTVIIMPEQDDDEVHFTTDGTTPTEESPRYTRPFSVVQTTTVKAIAVREGVSSDVAEKTFTKTVEGEYTLQQLRDGQKSVSGATVRLTNAQVVYGESNGQRSVRIVREGDNAIDLIDTDLYLPVGTVLNGSVKLDVNYNGGILTASDIAGETNQNDLSTTHDGNYEMRPVTVTGSQIANHPGDLIRIEKAAVSVENGACTATVADNGANYTVAIENGGDFGLKNGQKGNLTLYFSAPATTGCVATTRLASFEQEYEAPAAPVIEGDEFFEESTIISMTSEEGTTIHYTLDGSNPTTLSPLYTRPFKITETTTVKALAERNELASPMVEKTFTKKGAQEWVETTLADIAANKKSVPNAILRLNDAVVCFTPNYGKTWAVRDGENAMAWITKQSLATNYEYAGTIRVRVEYNGGFITVYDIDGETNMDDIDVTSHYGDWDYHFRNVQWEDIAEGKYKGDFINIKHVKVVKETDENGEEQYYAGDGEYRLWLDNKVGFTYYWNSDPEATHDVGGWYRGENEMFVCKLRLGVDNPTIEGDETFADYTYVTIVPANDADDLYYTLDGTDPDLESESTHNYIRPFRIDQTVVVRAVARRYEGESDVIEKTFRKDATGIAGVAAEDRNDGTQTYNMAGQRVGKGYKGIVIEKGHKVVRK